MSTLAQQPNSSQQKQDQRQPHSPTTSPAPQSPSINQSPQIPPSASSLTPSSVAGQIVKIAFQPSRASGFSDMDHLDGLVVDGARARFHTATPSHDIPLVLARLDQSNIDLVELHVQKASLEDVFIELTGAAPRE